ncbi:PH domain-containing protein [Cryptosporidium ubiquitum]|uniref:PH domain-containing protein n=1 Tax=Cryptosporidium ubiquitum TaxID=857276 RepID=A0A1J4MFA1_9CRYT|nr:PH domain-containing protein [Cryptosporidium ubiquitum]OII72918.1 PH domain-containing protein [Cryptosporidium ubiquitum]
MKMDQHKFSNSFETVNYNTEEPNNSISFSQSCNTIAEEQLAVLDSNLSKYSDVFKIQSKSLSQAEGEHNEDILHKMTNDEKNKKFIEIKLWEETRVEKYQNFVNAIDPIFSELSNSISQAMQINKDLASILQQKSKFWNIYSKNLELISQYSVKNGHSNSHFHNSNHTCSFCSSSAKSCSCSYPFVTFGLSNNFPLQLKPRESKNQHIQNQVNEEDLHDDTVKHEFKESNKNNSEMNFSVSDNNNTNNSLNINGISNKNTKYENSVSNNLLSSISSQQIWPILLLNYGRYESTFLKKLSQSVETDVVNGHLSWISKRYLNNAQGYLKTLRIARKEFEAFINNAQQSWNKYDDAFKKSQRLNLDVNYSVKTSKPCDTWYFDQIYRHNINKFIQAQTKFFDTLLVTIDNLMELESWRATSVKLTFNYFLVKQNEFFEFLQKLGNSIIDLINNQSKQNSLFQDNYANFDIITSIPGLRPPPIPITNELNFSKISQSLSNCPILQEISTLMNYNNLPKSSLIIYHGHVEIFKRKIFLGQWQSAYLILTKDRFLYLLNPKDDIEMEELLKHDEKPIWTYFIGSPDISIEHNEKRGKRCLSIKFKKQKFLTKKITIRCSNEDECNKWMNHLNSVIPPY